MKVKFIKSPTGKFNLAYNEGDTAVISDPLAKECIKEGYAEEVKTAKKSK